MTIEVLLSTPSRHDFQQKLSSFLVNGPGRIFLVTGNFSRYGSKAAPDLLSLLQWAAAMPQRKLDILVGIFFDGKAFQTQQVVADLKKQILDAQVLFKCSNPSVTMNIPVHFYGVKQWHAKAIGLTGLGAEFTKAEKIMFGSTNFSQSAMYGKNYEADIYADISSTPGQTLVNEYVYYLRELISDGIKTQGIADFHQQVLTALGGTVNITQDGFAFI